MDDVDDPLLELFHRRADLTAESFLNELRKQRNAPSLAQVASGAV
jgi:hypothetical protein